MWFSPCHLAKYNPTTLQSKISIDGYCQYNGQFILYTILEWRIKHNIMLTFMEVSFVLPRSIKYGLM